MSPSWGDVPTWLLFVGAAVTACLAFVAYRKQSDELRDQQKVNEKLAKVLPLQKKDYEQALEKYDREREDQRRAQANKIAAWTSLEDPGPPPRWLSTLRNASDLPVLDVTVKFYWAKEDPRSGKPWTPFIVGQKGMKLLTLPPMYSRDIPAPPPDKQYPLSTSGPKVLVGIEFTDGSGHRWERDPLGFLKDAEPTS